MKSRTKIAKHPKMAAEMIMANLLRRKSFCSKKSIKENVRKKKAKKAVIDISDDFKNRKKCRRGEK